METIIWFITEETPHGEDEEPGNSLCCIAWDKKSALQYLRDVILGQDLFDELEWELSAYNPDYYYGAGFWDDKWHYYMLCTESILGDAPSNKGVQPTP